MRRLAPRAAPAGALRSWRFFTTRAKRRASENSANVAINYLYWLFLSESSISHPLPVYALTLFLKESFERIFAAFRTFAFPPNLVTPFSRPTALKTTRLCIHTHHTFSLMMMRNFLLFLFFSAMMMMTLMVVVVEASWFRKSNTNGGEKSNSETPSSSSSSVSSSSSSKSSPLKDETELRFSHVNATKLLMEELSCDTCVAANVQIFQQIRNRAELYERAISGADSIDATTLTWTTKKKLKTSSRWLQPDVACGTRFRNRNLYSLKPVFEGGDKLYMAGPGFDHMRKNPRNNMFRREVESVLYQTCAKSLREHDAIEVYKKAIDEVASQSPGGRSGATYNGVLISFVTRMCLFPGPNNLDDVVNASREEKKQAKELLKRQTQYCKGERREERAQNYHDESQRVSKLLDEIKTKALTDASENAIDETTGKSNLQVAKRMCLSGKLEETTCLFIRLEFANAVPKLVAQLQNITENRKKLEHEISQTDEDENFDYDDEDYDGDGDFEEQFLEAKKTRLDANFNYTLKMATTACASLLEMKPNSASGTHNSAAVRRYAKDENAMEDAIAFAKKAIDLHVKNEDKMEGYKFISEANYALKKYDEAMKYAQMAKDSIDALSPGRVHAYRLLASLHVARTFREMASGEILTNAARIEKDELDHQEKESGSSKALSNEEMDLKRRALKLHDELKENLEAAAKMLDDIIWEDPRREHLINMGIALYLIEAANDNALGRFTKIQHDALTEAKQLCLLKPEHMEDHEKALCRDVLSLTGRKLVKEHFFALAGDALHMSLMYDEESSILWADVGFTQYSIGKLEIAKMCFDNAKKYDPENFVLPEDIRAALGDVGENALLQQHDEIKQAKKKREEEGEDEEKEEGENAGDIGESIRISSSSSSSHSSSEHRPEL